MDVRDVSRYRPVMCSKRRALPDTTSLSLDPHPVALRNAVACRRLRMDFGRRTAMGLAQILDLPVLRAAD